MKKINDHLQVGKLYTIYIPSGSRLIFDDIEYNDRDIFMILTSPQIITKSLFGIGPEKFINVKALVRDRVVNIDFKEYQINNFRKLVET